MRNSKLQFIRSLGYLDPHPDDRLYSALMLQPRIVGSLTVIGLLLQTPWLFLALSAALWWSALVPTRILFDAIYNYVVARPGGLAPLEAAPAPRRAAGGLAGVVTLAIGVALLAERARAPPRCQSPADGRSGGRQVFGRSCAGADLYHFLRRRCSPAKGAPLRCSTVEGRRRPPHTSVCTLLYKQRGRR